jgi:hypothetical protein
MLHDRVHREPIAGMGVAARRDAGFPAFYEP